MRYNDEKALDAVQYAQRAIELGRLIDPGLAQRANNLLDKAEEELGTSLQPDLSKLIEATIAVIDLLLPVLLPHLDRL